MKLKIKKDITNKNLLTTLFTYTPSRYIRTSFSTKLSASQRLQHLIFFHLNAHSRKNWSCRTLHQLSDIYLTFSNSELLTLFGVKSVEQFFVECKIVTNWDIHVSINCHILAGYSYQGSYCTFIECSLRFTPCGVNVYAFRFALFSAVSSNFFCLVNPSFLVVSFS